MKDEKMMEAVGAIRRMCFERCDCDGCPFAHEDLSCKLNGMPSMWDSDFGFDNHFRGVTKKPEDQFVDVDKLVDTPTDTPTDPDTPTDAPTTRAEILDAAKKIVTGEREQQYGKPEDNFAVIARFWEVYLNHRCVDAMSGLILNPDDVAMLMALMKVARIMTGTFKGDSYIDACGYLSCAAEIAGR